MSGKQQKRAQRRRTIINVFQKLRPAARNCSRHCGADRVCEAGGECDACDRPCADRKQSSAD